MSGEGRRPQVPAGHDARHAKGCGADSSRRKLTGASVAQASIAAKAPIAVEVEAGKAYRWCACGQSKTQPFCGGTHKSV